MSGKLRYRKLEPGIDRRSMSTGRAASAMEPLKYAEVPSNVKKAILEELG